MKRNRLNRFLGAILAVAITGLAIPAKAAPGEGRLTLAVTSPDLEPIVKSVCGGEMDTVTLFKGCLLRKDLEVERAARARLATCDVIVWSGFLRESAAVISARGEGKPEPKWIDLSPGAARTNLPTTPCFGAVDPAFATGDPFFWLNPENGAVAARNLARGLGAIQPGNRAKFQANAEAFGKALATDIQRWKAELKPLHALRVFCTQCGWQNFSALGGPRFIVCKGTPGELPSPRSLLQSIREAKADLIIVDPETPQDYVDYLRDNAGIRVVEVPSSIDRLPAGSGYAALFENLVKVLVHPGPRAGSAVARVHPSNEP